MAPDLNSLPPSPYQSTSNRHSPSTSRQPEPMASLPPPRSLSPMALSPSNYATSREQRPRPVDNTGVGVGPGPLRHPRPLTAADIYQEVEKEHEAVVNQLNRELSDLRQRTASVASTTSSTSTGFADAVDANTSAGISGSNDLAPSRRHRSSSSLSIRSANTAATGVTGTSGSTVGTTAGVAGSTTSGIAPPRDNTAPYPYPRDTLSRHSSIASRRSEASSPSLSSSFYQGDHFPNLHTHRHSPSQSQIQPSNPAPARSSHIPSDRVAEAAHARSELESVTRENEALRRRVQELERTLSSRRQSGVGLSRGDSVSTRVLDLERTIGREGGGLGRSDSISTNASVQRSAGRGRGLEDEDDAVNVGESAGSVGIGGGH